MKLMIDSKKSSYGGSNTIGRSEVENYLDSLGFDYKLKGYGYLCEIIPIAFDHPKMQVKEICMMRYPRDNYITIYRACDYSIYKALRNRITTKKLIKDAILTIMTDKEETDEDRSGENCH